MDRAVEEVFEKSAAESLYYRRISAVYRAAEFVFLFALLAFLVLSAVQGAGEISYGNFENIVRDFALQLDTNEQETADIRFDPDGDITCAVLGKGFCVCGSTRITTFSATGRKIFTTPHGFSDPLVRSGGKNVILWEENGNKYSVYSLFSEVCSANLDFPIYAVRAGADGSYAIITRNDHFRSVVLLYNEKNVLIGRYCKQDYVICAEPGPDGQLLLLTLSTNESGDLSTRIELCRVGEESPELILTEEGSMPLSCGFTSRGFCTVSSSGTKFYSVDGNLLGQTRYENGSLFRAVISDSGAVLLRTGDAMKLTYYVSVLDNGGSVITERELTGTARDAVMIGESAFLLTEENITEIRADGIFYLPQPDIRAGSSLLAVSDHLLYLCRSGGMTAIKLNQRS